MSRGMGRKDFFIRDRNWESYRRYEKPRHNMKRSHSPLRDKRSSSPHRNKKDIDDNLLNDKPKSHDVWDNHRQDFSIPPPPPSFSTQDVIIFLCKILQFFYKFNFVFLKCYGAF